MATKNFSSFFGLGEAAFSNHDRAYTETLAEAATNAAGDNFMQDVLSYSDAFPTICAFISEDDPATILLGSHPTFYRGAPGLATTADESTVVFLGNQEESLVPFVLPDAAFGRVSALNSVVITTDTLAHYTAFAARGGGC